MNHRRMLLSAIVLGLAGLASEASAEGLPEFTAQFNLQKLKTAATQMPQIAGKQAPSSAQKTVPIAVDPNVVLESGSTSASLPNCKGYVEIEVIRGTAYLNFRDVDKCVKFNVTNSKGESLNYSEKRLWGRERHLIGSFRMPKSFIDLGHDGIIIKLESDMETVRDSIRVHFWAI